MKEKVSPWKKYNRFKSWKQEREPQKDWKVIWWEKKTERTGERVSGKYNTIPTEKGN